MKVEIDFLQKIISLLLLRIKEQNGNTVELSNDFYWDISNEDLYQAYSEPKEFTLGQISQDLIEIERLLESPDEAIPYDLKRVAELIKAISIENSTVF